MLVGLVVSISINFRIKFSLFTSHLYHCMGVNFWGIEKFRFFSMANFLFRPLMGLTDGS
jgi:hypothetical protein